LTTGVIFYTLFTKYRFDMSNEPKDNVVRNVKFGKPKTVGNAVTPVVGNG